MTEVTRDQVADLLRAFADYTIGRSTEPDGITYEQWADRVLLHANRSEGCQIAEARLARIADHIGRAEQWGYGYVTTETLKAALRYVPEEPA